MLSSLPGHSATWRSPPIAARRCVDDFEVTLHSKSSLHKNTLFLPAAKPTGHRKVRVIVAVFIFAVVGRLFRGHEQKFGLVHFEVKMLRLKARLTKHREES